MSGLSLNIPKPRPSPQLHDQIMAKTHATQVLERLLFTKGSYAEFAAAVQSYRDGCIEEDKPRYAETRMLSRMDIDRSEGFKKVINRFVRPLVDKLSFPATVSAKDVNEVLADHLAGFKLQPDEPKRDLGHLFRCFHYLHERVVPTEGVLMNYRVSIGGASELEELKERRVASVDLEVPENFWQHEYPEMDPGVQPEDPIDDDTEDPIDAADEEEALIRARQRADTRFLASRAWCQPIWEGAHGASLYLLPKRELHCSEWEEDTVEMRCDAFLDGEFTEAAMKEAVARMGPILNSVFSVVAASATRPESRDAADRIVFNTHTILGVDPDPESWEDLHVTASLAFFFSASAKNIFQQAIPMLATAPSTDEDSLERRICNAFKLIGLEAEVPDDGLALALSFAAAESLLTERDDSTTKQLAELSAVLLQPDPAKRRAAQRQVRRLYEYRNAVMHGRRIEGNKYLRRMARRFAAGVVRAVLAYRWHLQRIGSGCSRKDLLTELIVSSRKNQALVGVEDLSDLLPVDVPTKAS